MCSKYKSIINKIIAVFMCVLTLSFSIFSSVVNASDVTTSAGVYGFLWDVFLSLGSTVLVATGCIDSVEEFSDIDVAQFGADFMVEKMGLEVETANIVADFLTPDKYNDYVVLSEEAANAYLNGEISIEDLKSNSVDGAFSVYMNNLFDDIEAGIASFVSDVLLGENELVLGSQIITVDDIYYDGNLQVDINGNYIVNISGSYIYGSLQEVMVTTSTAYMPFVIISADYSSLSVMCCYKPSDYLTGYPLKVTGSRYYNGKTYSIDNISNIGASGASDGSWSANVPIFLSADTTGIKAYVQSGDSSSCINLEEKTFDYQEIFSNVSSSLSNFVSKGAYKAKDLYNTLTDVYSNLSNNVITDSSTYVDVIADALDTLTVYDITNSDTVPDTPVIDSGTSVVKPSSDAELMEWIEYFADSLSMSWTWGSDIPDIFVDIGEYVQDIPSILDGIEDGFADVVDVGSKTWEKVAEIPDIINFGVDDILAGLTSVSDVISVPLTGVLEGVNTHTGILEGIQEHVISIPDAISTSLENVISDVKDFVLSLPDYTGLLEKIIALLEAILSAIAEFITLITSFFIIDAVVIRSHLSSAITNIPEYDVFEPIIGYFDYFRSSISDSYDYPVISITTPDILLPYYKEPEIILVDFADYAKYFVWARAIISFSLYFGFGIWLIKDMKKFFSGL